MGVTTLPAVVRIERALDATSDLVVELAGLLPLLSSVAPPDLDGLSLLLADDDTYLFVARDDDGSALGTLTLAVFHLLSGTRSLIEDVVVSEAARGKGVGAALVNEAIRVARALGVRNIDLTSRPSRQAANRLYERCGFERRETNVYRRTLELPG